MGDQLPKQNEGCIMEDIPQLSTHGNSTPGAFDSNKAMGVGLDI